MFLFFSSLEKRFFGRLATILRFSQCIYARPLSLSHAASALPFFLSLYSHFSNLALLLISFAQIWGLHTILHLPRLSTMLVTKWVWQTRYYVSLTLKSTMRDLVTVNAAVNLNLPITVLKPSKMHLKSWTKLWPQLSKLIWDQFVDIIFVTIADEIIHI